MSNKGKRPMRSMTPIDKIEAIKRVHEGTSKAQVAREIGVPESTLRGWCKNEEKLRYMISRQSPSQSPPLQSDDSQPPGKRSRTESPETSNSPNTSELNLSTSNAHTEPQLPITPPEAVVVTTKRNNTSSDHYKTRERRSAHESTITMSAISPTSNLLSGYPPLNPIIGFQGLNQYDLLTYATSLLHSSIPLGPLAPNRTLRSVRTPKPGRVDSGGNTNANKNQHRHKPSMDSYRMNGSNLNTFNQSALDHLKYLFPNQNMLDVTARQSTPASNAFQFGQSNDAALPTKSAAPTAPYLLDYYNRFGGALASPDEMMKAAASVPATRTAENILHTQLTKGKRHSDYSNSKQAHNINGKQTKAPESKYGDSLLPEEIRNPEEASSLEEAKGFEVGNSHNEATGLDEKKNLEGIAKAKNLEEPQCTKESKSPEVSKTGDVERENKEPSNRQPPLEIKRNQKDLHQVLENIICNNRNQLANNVAENNCPGAGDLEQGLEEALTHGDKLLAWLERQTSNPSVTQVNVGQLRTLLNNLRTRRYSVQNRNGTRRQ